MQTIGLFVEEETNWGLRFYRDQFAIYYFRLITQNESSFHILAPSPEQYVILDTIQDFFLEMPIVAAILHMPRLEQNITSAVSL